MSFKTLLKFCDEKYKSDFEGYYIVSKNKIDMLINNFEKQANRIKDLAKIITDQQEQIEGLQNKIIISPEEND